MTKKYW